MNQHKENKHLIVFVSNFPFGLSEPYFATELSYLIKDFYKISIVPSDLSKEAKRDKIYFPLPPEVRIHNWTIAHRKKQYINGFFKGLFSKIFWNELRYIFFEFKSDHTNLGLLYGKWLAFKVAFVSWCRASTTASYIQNEFLDKKEVENSVFYSYWCTDVTLGMALLKERGRKEAMVTRIHAWDLYFYRDASGYLPFRKCILKNLDATFSISQAGKNYLVDRIGKEVERKVHIARLGSDRILAPPYFPKSKTLRILSISKIIPLKRIDLLVASLAIAKSSVSICWHHWGGTDSLIQRSAESALTGVDFHFFPFAAKENFYKHLSENTYDILVNLSTSEGLPVSMMEAMSLGIPVVATDVGAVSEIVQHGETGWLLPVDSSPQEIAQRLIHIAHLETEQMALFRKKAHCNWNNYFNSAKNYPEFSEKLFRLNS